MPIYVIAEKLKLIDYIGYSILVSTLINMQGDGLCFHRPICMQCLCFCYGLFLTVLRKFNKFKVAQKIGSSSLYLHFTLLCK